MMALSFMDKETDRLAHANASPAGGPTVLADHLMQIGRHCAAVPDHDTCTLDQIVAYDETGMWW
jgi:hypothetical protein